MTEPAPGQPRVRLYCRADAAPPARRRQRTVRNRLVALAEEGDVADVEVETWPRAVPLVEGDPLGPHAEARAAFETFEAWAEETDASLAPFFDRRERYTLEDPSSSTRECLLPVVALTVREDGEVVAAYPHTLDGEARGVDEALAALESTPAGPSVDAEAEASQRETAD